MLGWIYSSLLNSRYHSQRETWFEAKYHKGCSQHSIPLVSWDPMSFSDFHKQICDGHIYNFKHLKPFIAEHPIFTNSQIKTEI